MRGGYNALQKEAFLWAIFGGACLGHSYSANPPNVALLLDDYWHSFADLYDLMILIWRVLNENFCYENTKACSCAFKKNHA